MFIIKNRYRWFSIFIFIMGPNIFSLTHTTHTLSSPFRLILKKERKKKRVFSFLLLSLCTHAHTHTHPIRDRYSQTLFKKCYSVKGKYKRIYHLTQFLYHEKQRKKKSHIFYLKCMSSLKLNKFFMILFLRSFFVSSK